MHASDPELPAPAEPEVLDFEPDEDEAPVDAMARDALSVSLNHPFNGCAWLESRSGLIFLSEPVCSFFAKVSEP
jgi:hypothetical protein